MQRAFFVTLAHWAQKIRQEEIERHGQWHDPKI